MISLDFRDSRPVYEQIHDKIKNLIVEGILKEGDKIMSVREMAANLTINPNTIVKAFRELENDGYVYSVQGKGYFVADKTYTAAHGNINTLMQTAENALRELCFLGVDKEIAENMIEKIWKGMKKND